MSPASAPALAAAVEVKIDGEALGPATTQSLLEVRVQDNLRLPDAFMLRLSDPECKLTDGSMFTVGAKIELSYTGAGNGSPTGKFKGEIATIAPRFERDGCVLVVRGYDISHKLNRSSKTRTFQDMTASDIARKIIGEAGLTADVVSTSNVYPFEQQSNETDWDYLWRLAARVSYEVGHSEGEIHFRPPGDGADAAIRVEWGRDLFTFHPRATAVAQVESVTVSGWNPKTKSRVESTATSAKLDSKIGLQRDAVAQGLGGGTVAIAGQIVTSTSEATALAQSTLDRLANTWLEADGICMGNPKIRAGTKLQVEKVGSRFGGEYLVTKSTHIIRGAKSYETEFEISGRSRRTLIDLLTPTIHDDFASGLVIGVVTNNDDPEKMGRVRVKFPGLDEQKEGWWARVASLAASGKRGAMMMPLVDDEVVIGFEHGDPRRPFVLGALWNGTSKPEKLAGDAAKPDGSFNLHSNTKIAISSDAETSLKATKDLAITADAKMDTKVKSDSTLTATGKIAIKSNGSELSITCGGGSVVIKQDGSITVKGTQITIEAQAQLSLKSSGMVQVKGSQIMLG